MPSGCWFVSELRTFLTFKSGIFCKEGIDLILFPRLLILFDMMITNFCT